VSSITRPTTRETFRCVLVCRCVNACLCVRVHRWICCATCPTTRRHSQGKDEEALEFDLDYKQALDQVISSYPQYVRVRELRMHGELDDKLELARVLVSNGVVSRLPPPPKS
jgi:hypothetical protein